MKRPYSLFILAFLPFLSQAQGPADVYRYDCSEAIRPSEKLVRASIASFDPKALVTFDDTQLKVKLDRSVDPIALQTALNRLEHGTFTLVRSERSGVKGTLHSATPFPTYVDTGNPDLDNAAFAQAKQAWRTANPEAHEALLKDQRKHQPVPYE